MQIFANQLQKFRKRTENKGIFSNDRCTSYENYTKFLMRIQFPAQGTKKKLSYHFFGFRIKV